jgi:hypothetical protein
VDIPDDLKTVLNALVHLGRLLSEHLTEAEEAYDKEVAKAAIIEAAERVEAGEPHTVLYDAMMDEAHKCGVSHGKHAIIEAVALELVSMKNDVLEFAGALDSPVEDITVH